MVKDGPKAKTATKARPIDPTAIYFTKDVMEILDCARSTILRWKKYGGLPITGTPRGFITGRLLLEWIENRGKQVTP